MKHRAIVTDVTDPKALGRLKARVVGFGETDNDEQHNVTPWCWPNVPMATADSGTFCMPPVGAEVWVEQAHDGAWVWTGCFWSGRHPAPALAQAPDVRLIRTPAGHHIKIDEAGDVELLHANGNRISLRSGGDTDIEVTADCNITVAGQCNITSTGKTVVNASQIEFNGATGRVVTTECLCQVTGAPHAQGAIFVKSEGPFG